MEAGEIMRNSLLLGTLVVLSTFGISIAAEHDAGLPKGQPGIPRATGAIELDIKKPDLVPRRVMGAASDAAMHRHTINLKDNIFLEMTAPPFDAAKHKVTECEIMGSKAVCLIDGRPVFGTDWTLPKSELVQATVRIGSLAVDLDVSCMFNPSIDKPDAQDFTIESVYGGLVIRGNFSDAAGRYTAEWLVVQNSSVRTRLEHVAE